MQSWNACMRSGYWHIMHSALPYDSIYYTIHISKSCLFVVYRNTIFITFISIYMYEYHDSICILEVLISYCQVSTYSNMQSQLQCKFQGFMKYKNNSTYIHKILQLKLMWLIHYFTLYVFDRKSENSINHQLPIPD